MLIIEVKYNLCVMWGVLLCEIQISFVKCKTESTYWSSLLFGLCKLNWGRFRVYIPGSLCLSGRWEILGYQLKECWSFSCIGMGQVVCCE